MIKNLKTNQKINRTEVLVNHIFSELSHYTYKGVNPATGLNKLYHHGSGNTIEVDDRYLCDLMQSAEQYHNVVTVGLVDTYWTAKQVEDAIKNGVYSKSNAPEVGSLKQKGIRTVFDEIKGQHVFTCMYMAQSKETVKELNERKRQQRDNLLGSIKTGLSKSELLATVDNILEQAQNDPIVKTDRERVLRGYKVQFTSHDGKYLCKDMDINEERPVNINTLQWLVYDGVKYQVKN